LIGFTDYAAATPENSFILTLLQLGVKGINLGPRPPAFITPGVFTRLPAASGL